MPAQLYTIQQIRHGHLLAMAHPTSGPGIQQEFDSIAAQKITHVVSLLEKKEAEMLGLEHEEKLCEERNISFIHFPIPDLTLPNPQNDFIDLTQRLHRLCSDGSRVLVHCRAGIGRTGMTCAAILMHNKLTAAEAIKSISEARGLSIPDTKEQTEFINALQFEIGTT